jgi:hypothetical protein
VGNGTSQKSVASRECFNVTNGELERPGQGVLSVNPRKMAVDCTLGNRKIFWTDVVDGDCFTGVHNSTSTSSNFEEFQISAGSFGCLDFTCVTAAPTLTPSSSPTHRTATPTSGAHALGSYGASLATLMCVLCYFSA